ncbi:MAG: fimbria/pilus outer membrane usher protein [Pseudoxanthomonas sp.]
MPYVFGNNVTVVTTDASGRQMVTTQAYYYNASLLRQGITKYSLDIGVPRFSYGQRSDDYDRTVFGAGSIRRGLLDSSTVEGHAEFSGDGLSNLGGGLIQGLWGRGTLTAAAAASRYRGYSGSLGYLALEGQVLGMRAFASSQRTFGDYFDLGRVSSARYLHRESDSASYLDGTAVAKVVDRAGASFTPWFDPTSISLSYNRIRYGDSQTRTANLSLSRGLSRRVSVFANGYKSLGGDHDSGVYVMFNVNLGLNTQASVGLQNSNGQARYTQQVSSNMGARQDSVNWALSNTSGDGEQQQSAALGYLSRYARLSGRYYRYGDDRRSEVEAAGSVLATAAGVFAANSIGDAYAIVQNAGPGAEILQGGVRMGHANRNGRFLLPSIQPYYEQRLFVDPAGLPDGWELDQTERTAVAGYRQGVIVDFGATPVHGAVLVLNDADGRPLAPGLTASLAGGESAVVGYGGQVYLRHLQADNRVTVDLGSSGACSVEFRYDADGPAQPTLGPYPCR